MTRNLAAADYGIITYSKFWNILDITGKDEF